MIKTNIKFVCMILALSMPAKDALADPIDRLVVKMNGSYGLWLNGITPVVSLPPDAKANEVIAEALKAYRSNFPGGFVETYKIREVRKVKIGGEVDVYSAALVHSDFGSNIWLFRPLEGNQWWVRFYDIPKDELLDAAEPKVIASGEWSKPVVDKDGYAVSGRLVLCEKSASDDRREIVVYVELRDATKFVGRSMRLYCDLGKRDFRPDYKSGLQCEMKDSNGRLVESASSPFGGAVPLSQWVTLPSDATIRLRASPFGIHRPQAMAISPHLGSLWVIADDDPNEYSLAGTFAIVPPEDGVLPGDEHVWIGTIDLPPVRIVNKDAEGTR